MNTNTARTAGVLYLVVVLTGMFSLLYVPSQITVDGNALATVGNIVAHNSLFRLGIATELIGHVAFLLLPFVLYKLLSPINREAAVLMVAFAVVSVKLCFVNNGPRRDRHMSLAVARWCESAGVQRWLTRPVALLASR